jgi:hypothetical protein
MTETVASWGIVDDKGNLVKQDGYPMLARNKAMAKVWCDRVAGEKPVRVYISYELSDEVDA